MLSVVADGQDGDGLHFAKFSFDFSEFSYPSLRLKQTHTMDYSSSKNLIDILVLPKFQGNVFSSSKG